MRKISFLFILIFLPLSVFLQTLNVSGSIKNFEKQYFQIYKVELDTLILVDSMMTDAKGNFQVKISDSKFVDRGMYQFNVIDQSFFVLNDFKPIVLETRYEFDYFNNKVKDNLVIKTSDENIHFQTFQRQQMLVNVARELLLQLLHIYPNGDPFYEQILKQYYDRYENYDLFIKKHSNKQKTDNLFLKIAKAYYIDQTPDWKLTAEKRQLQARAVFFDYFNPADDFFYHTNVIPDKLEEWLTLHIPLRENQKIDENLMAHAAIQFILKTHDNPRIYQFVLKKALTRFVGAHLYTSFLKVYDAFMIVDHDDCDQTTDDLLWARNLASDLRNIQIGKVAPDFVLKDNLKMHDLKSDYTVLMFWATWCSHCVSSMPEIQKTMDDFKLKNKTKASLNVVAVSLDRDEEAWKSYIKFQGLESWIHVSDLKGWNNEVGKLYNIYSTPTFIVLGKNKEILGVLEESEDLDRFLNSLNK
ncbi:MAG: thioredoxin family protein [Bacteroidales bacterium]|nr:thioredoxin family protein [Bacteroidales bacterium]